MPKIFRNEEEKITLQDVLKTQKIIEPFLRKTPLIYSQSLSTIMGANIYLKCEHLTESGAFKIRGAINAVAHLSTSKKLKGVATFSTGNHGLAVAIASAKFGTQATICISRNVPQAKKDLIRSFGARLEIIGESQDEAEDFCYRLERTEGITVIPPFDHPDIISGQGTLALEILEDLPEVDCVIAGLSGGGLLSGISIVMKSTNPAIKVIGLSMEKGAAMHESLLAGHPVTVKEHETLADSLLGGIGQNNRYTFPIISKYLDESLLISEAAIAKGMSFLFKHHHMIIEGAGAIATGALLDHKINIQPSTNVVLVLSGGNIDLEEHRDAISPYLNDD